MGLHCSRALKVLIKETVPSAWWVDQQAASGTAASESVERAARGQERNSQGNARRIKPWRRNSQVLGTAEERSPEVGAMMESPDQQRRMRPRALEAGTDGYPH